MKQIYENQSNLKPRVNLLGFISLVTDRLKNHPEVSEEQLRVCGLLFENSSKSVKILFDGGSYEYFKIIIDPVTLKTTYLLNNIKEGNSDEYTYTAGENGGMLHMVKTGKTYSNEWAPEGQFSGSAIFFHDDNEPLSETDRPFISTTVYAQLSAENDNLNTNRESLSDVIDYFTQTTSQIALAEELEKQ